MSSFSNRNWNLFLAWLAGLLVFFSIFASSFKVIMTLGFPVDGDAFVLGPGSSLIILSIMIACPTGLSVYKGKIRGLFNAKDKIWYSYTFIGVLLYGVISFFLGLTFGFTSIYVLFLDFAVMAVLVSIFWPLLNRKIESLSSPDDQLEKKKPAIARIIDNLLMCTIGGVVLALFLASAWVAIKFFKMIEDFLDDTFLEGFAFVIWMITFFGTLFGLFIIWIKANDWLSSLIITKPC